jgi:hypothetical protein
MTAAEKLVAAIKANNSLFDQATRLGIETAALEREWCRLKKVDPAAGVTRAAYERKSGSLRRLGNWKRGLSQLATLIVNAKGALAKGGTDSFDHAAHAAWCFAEDFRDAIEDDHRRHAERRAGMVPSSHEAAMINSLAEALEKAYTK